MNDNNFASNKSRMVLCNQNCDLPLPPPPAHILALVNQSDSPNGTESQYLMPPPPSLSSVINNTLSDFPETINDSIVPPPMPIINPPPRQSPIISTSKTKSSNLISFHSAPPISMSTTTSSLLTSSSSIISQNISLNSSIINSSKFPKVSPPISFPIRISPLTTTTRSTENHLNNTTIDNSSSNNTNEIVSILKPKSLPPLYTLNNKNSVSSANHCATGSSVNSGSSEISGLSSGSSRDFTYCTVCGQTHELSANHVYSYRESVDTDLLCQLCYHPLVDPLETKCGHTFCTACLKSHLAVQAFCPEDKQIINYLECSPASIIVKRLLDKLMIICPNCDGCDEIMPRSELEAHLLYWCRAIPSQSNNNNNHNNNNVHNNNNHNNINNNNNNNLNLTTTFQAPKSSTGNTKWDGGFEKSPNINSAIFSSTNSEVQNNSSVLSTVVSSCEDSKPITSSSHEMNNVKCNANRTAGATSANYHKNTVRFDAMPQPRKKNYSGNEDYNISNDFLTCVNIDCSTNSDFGISFVGGSDTPLQCIVIQEIYLDGAVAKDGRLRPGDQIISINGIDLNHATHLQARNAFLQAQQQPGAKRLMIYRIRAEESEKEEILQFGLTKRIDKKLGIKLVGQKGKPGLYVLDLVKGSEADLDGRLRKNDRILKINDVDLRMETQDTAARVINNAGDEVNIVVSRIIRPQTPDLIRTIEPDSIFENFDPICQTTSFSPPKSAIRKSSGTWYPFEKVVTVDKNYGESLGMSVAGGVNSQRGDTPVYVTNLAVDGVLAKTQQIVKGDILLAVNETELLGLSHEKAVEALKSAGQKCKKVNVRILQGPETVKSKTNNFLPSWVYWLQLPKYCEIPRLITLKRDSATGSLGFSIVGGVDISQQTSPKFLLNNQNQGQQTANMFHQPIVVKSIVTGSVAHRNGRLKCGDILLKINKISLINVSHDEAVSLFKNVQDEVVLQVVSWPGTII